VERRCEREPKKGPEPEKLFENMEIFNQSSNRSAEEVDPAFFTCLFEPLHDSQANRELLGWEKGLVDQKGPEKGIDQRGMEGVQ